MMHGQTIWSLNQHDLQRVLFKPPIVCGNRQLMRLSLRQRFRAGAQIDRH